MPVLGPADYPQVRGALGADVTSGDLPDALIGMDIYQGVAEDWATARIPDVSLLSVEDAARLHRAAILYLAGLLAPSLPDYTMRRDGGLQGTEEQMRPVDRSKQQEFLQSRAESILQSILDLLPFVAAPRPSVFRTAQGCRGR